jgi:hypothetical protein
VPDDREGRYPRVLNGLYKAISLILLMEGGRLRGILDEFKKEMKSKGVPFYVAGIIKDAQDNPAIEIVVSRPERYNNPEIAGRIPKAYRGVRVQVA